MKKILLLVACSCCLLFSAQVKHTQNELKHLPFGIKDICKKITKAKTYTLCSNDGVKWISYSFSKDAEYKAFSQYKSESDKIYKDITSQGFKALRLTPNSNTSEGIFIISDSAYSNFLKINSFFDKAINLTSKKNINIIQGVVTSSNSLGLLVEKEKILLPEYYYAIVTDIDNKQVIDIFLLDISKNEIINSPTLSSIRSITNTELLNKIKN